MAPRLTDLLRRLTGAREELAPPEGDLRASEATHVVQQIPEVGDEVLVAHASSDPQADTIPTETMSLNYEEVKLDQEPLINAPGDEAKIEVPEIKISIGSSASEPAAGVAGWDPQTKSPTTGEPVDKDETITIHGNRTEAGGNLNEKWLPPTSGAAADDHEIEMDVHVGAAPPPPPDGLAAPESATGAADGNDVATEELTLAHEGFEPAAAKGNVEYTWKIEEGVKGESEDPPQDLGAPEGGELPVAGHRIFDISDPADPAAEPPRGLAAAAGADADDATNPMKIDGFLKVPDIPGGSADGQTGGTAGLRSDGELVQAASDEGDEPAAGKVEYGWKVEEGTTAPEEPPSVSDVVLTKQTDNADGAAPAGTVAVPDGAEQPPYDPTEVPEKLSDGGAGEGEYLEWELKNAQVTSYQLGGAAEDDDAPSTLVGLGEGSGGAGHDDPAPEVEANLPDTPDVDLDEPEL